MGCAVAIFMHLNGNGAVIFYSATLFRKANVSPSIGTIVTITLRLFANFPAMAMLRYFGRRSLLLFWNTMIIIFLFLMGLFTLKNMPLGTLICTASFMTCCVFGPGPITWIYCAETMNYKGVSAANTLNLAMDIVIAFASKPMMESKVIGKYVFMIFGVIYILVNLVLFLFLKETKGLTEE